MSTDLEVAPCPMGCPVADVVVCISKDLIHGVGGEFQVVRCEQCALVRTNPRPTADDIGAYYPAEYSPHATLSRTAGWRSKLQALAGLRDHWLPDIPPGHVLEIGCANGDFLVHMKSLGWTVEGIEPGSVPAGVAGSKGLHIQNTTVESAEPPTQPADLVVAWMALEHFHHPVDALRKLAGWSAADASLVVSLPNLNGLSFRLFERYWYDLDVPRHLYHFTPETATSMLAASGWRVERVVYQRSVRELALSFSFWISARSKDARISRWSSWAANSSLASYVLVPLGYFLAWRKKTRMTVWAKRI